MKSKITKVLQFLFFLLTGLALLYFAFRGIDLDEVILQIQQADYRWVAFSGFFCVLALVVRAFRWRLLIEPLNDRPPTTVNIYHAITIGYLANFVFPRIGEVTRCGVLNRIDKIPIDKLFGTVVVERAFDLLMTALMLCLILILRFDVVGSFFAEHLIQPIAGVMNIGLIAALVALILFTSLWIFRKQLSKISVLRKLKNLLHGVLEGIKSVRQLRNFKLFFVLNILVFVIYFLQAYVLFFAFESSSSLSAVDALFVFVLSAIAIIIPVQGGIGAFHWIVSIGLTILGLSREEGMVYATVSHSVTSILLILTGAISLIFVFSMKKNKN